MQPALFTCRWGRLGLTWPHASPIRSTASGSRPCLISSHLLMLIYVGSRKARAIIMLDLPAPPFDCSLAHNMMGEACLGGTHPCYSINITSYSMAHSNSSPLVSFIIITASNINLAPLKQINTHIERGAQKKTSFSYQN